MTRSNDEKKDEGNWRLTDQKHAKRRKTKLKEGNEE
jgi:hypothetical protein